jgi:hypothetical protein
MKMKKVSTFLFIFIIVFTTNVFSQVPTAGLVAYYPFNGNANDSSGNGNNGTVHGATLTADRFGNPNRAYNFAGNAYISHPELFQSTVAAYSFSVWVVLDTFANAQQSILYKGASQGETQVVVNPSKKFNFQVKLTDGNWYSCPSIDTVKNDSVYHLAGRYIKGSKIDFWINGVEQDTAVVPNLNLNTVAYPSSSSIGAYNNNNVYSQYWNGVIDDIRFYNRALADSEIIELYHETITGIRSDNNSMPQGFLLLQNYPNPFNPSTVISYQLSVDSKVSLKVYNVLGKEVTTLVDGEQRAGEHSVNFNANNLTNGVYFYQLNAGNFTQTKKMVLLK